MSTTHIIYLLLFLTSAYSRHTGNWPRQTQLSETPDYDPKLLIDHNDGDDMSNYVKFYLYTRLNPDKYQKLLIDNATSIHSSHYNTDYRTTIVVHGFLSNIESDLDQYIKKDLLKLEDHNIIGVDWSLLAFNPIYSIAAAETKEVGQYVARFINYMQNVTDLDLNDIHLIGHSLGAHVVGFAGKAMSPKILPRITGLDPAMPAFENVTPEQRLDVGDAVIVDCIHTASGTLGLLKPICLMDFYPNGGMEQPGCSFLDFGICDHSRAYDYYAESINPTHRFHASKCSIIPVTHHKNYCVPSKQLMGAQANASIPGIFYVATNGEYPFSQDIQ